MYLVFVEVFFFLASNSLSALTFAAGRLAKNLALVSLWFVTGKSKHNHKKEKKRSQERHQENPKNLPWVKEEKKVCETPRADQGEKLTCDLQIVPDPGHCFLRIHLVGLKDNDRLCRVSLPGNLEGGLLQGLALDVEVTPARDRPHNILVPPVVRHHEEGEHSQVAGAVHVDSGVTQQLPEWAHIGTLTGNESRGESLVSQEVYINVRVGQQQAHRVLVTIIGRHVQRGEPAIGGLPVHVEIRMVKKKLDGMGQVAGLDCPGELFLWSVKFRRRFRVRERLLGLGADRESQDGDHKKHRQNPHFFQQENRE